MVYAMSMDSPLHRQDAEIKLPSSTSQVLPPWSQQTSTMSTHDDKYPISTTHGDSMETGDDIPMLSMLSTGLFCGRPLSGCWRVLSDYDGTKVL